MSLSYLHKGEHEVSFEEHGAQSFRMECLDTVFYSLAKVHCIFANTPPGISSIIGESLIGEEW